MFCSRCAWCGQAQGRGGEVAVVTRSSWAQAALGSSGPSGFGSKTVMSFDLGLSLTEGPCILPLFQSRILFYFYRVGHSIFIFNIFYY